MTLDFLIIADGANIADGKVNIHGGAITRTTFPAFPSNPMLLTAVARFLIDADETDRPQERDVTFVLSREDGTQEPLGGGTLHWVPVDIREGEEQAVVVIAPALLAFPEPGRYELRLLLDGELVGARALLVRADGEPPAPVVPNQ